MSGGINEYKERIKENIGHKGGCHDGNDNDTEDPGSTCRVGSVEAGQLIMAKLDVVMANDITGPMALPIVKQNVRSCV